MSLQGKRLKERSSVWKIIQATLQRSLEEVDSMNQTK